MKENKFFKILKNPTKTTIVLNFVLTLIFAISSILLVVFDLNKKIYSFVIYGFAGVSLAFFIYILVLKFPDLKKSYLNALKNHKFTNKLYEDYKFRTMVFACFSVFINFCFSGFEIVIGALGRSIWFGSLGLYHLILSLTRFGIIFRYYQQSKVNIINYMQKLKTYRNTGICILIFNLALSGAMGQMIFNERAFSYAGLMIFAISAYSFYKITLAIWGIFKSKKYKDLNTQAILNLKLTDAMISIYALQTALIETFSVEGSNMKFMNIATGIVVTILSLGIGVFMILKSKREQSIYLLNKKEEKNECN